nr:MAG TPA: hypothetical protein [Caudoviricetes sp.]
MSVSVCFLGHCLIHAQRTFALFFIFYPNLKFYFNKIFASSLFVKLFHDI